MLFNIVYDTQDIRGENSLSLLAVLLFGIIWNSEDQNNELDNPEQNPARYDSLES